MKRLIYDFLSLIFPRICSLCKGPRVRNEPIICSLCQLKLPRERNYNGKNNNTANRLRGMFSFSEAYSFLRFTKKSSVQTIVHRIKYQSDEKLALQLGIWFASEVLIHLSDRFEIIVPVPLHKEKLKSRGYNQSMEIARGIAKITGHPIKNLLVRTHHAETQTSLSRWDRFENTANEFNLSDQEQVKNQRILLLDDIITTGATITGTAVPLIDAGAGGIIVAATGLTRNI